MGPLSGRWRQGGNDQQYLAAPIWKYRSGIGNHRFTFFIELLSNYTFYTNQTNIVHWVVAYRDVAHLITLNLGKSWEKYAKSFDAGLKSVPRLFSYRHKELLPMVILMISWFNWCCGYCFFRDYIWSDCNLDLAADGEHVGLSTPSQVGGWHVWPGTT